MPVLLQHDYSMGCNKDGYVKLEFVRDIFGEVPSVKDFPEMMFFYETWRDTDELMPIRKTFLTEAVFDFKDTAVDPQKWVDQYDINTGLHARILQDEKVLYQLFKEEVDYKICPKRGNDAYLNIVKKRFEPLLKNSNNKTFFTYSYNKNRKRSRKTRLLYVTGSLDHSIVNGPVNSWLEFGKWFNQFRSNLRSQFGKLETLRTWQSQKNGYPHFHALFYFKDFEFSAVPWTNEKGKLEFRIHPQQKLKKGDKLTVRERIKLAWKYGGLDIECCSDSKKAFKDLLKYVIRDLEGGEALLTNTLVWYFRKRSFSVSRGFLELFQHSDSVLAEPTTDDLINAEGVIKSSNSKKKLVMIEIFPIIGAEIVTNFVPKHRQLSLIDDKGPPQIPKYDVSYVDRLEDICEISSERVRGDGVKIVVYRKKPEGNF